MQRKTIVFSIFIAFLFGLHLTYLMAASASSGQEAALSAAHEVAPMSIEGSAGLEMARYSDRTLSLAFELDRDQARLIAFTLKSRPFVRFLLSSELLPEPRTYEEGKEPQIEIVLLGPGGARFTQRMGIGMICLSHSGDTLPHVTGDTIIVHRDTFIAEVPEISGFNTVEIAYYIPGVNGIERRSLAVESLGPERFMSAGSSFRWKDLAIATQAQLKEGDEGKEGSLLGTSGKVYWPEDFGDPDIYRVYGNEVEMNKRINVVIVPDGYTYAEKSIMENHASSLANYFRNKTPYAEHDPFINYTLVYAYSTESGTDQCDCTIIKDTAMDSRFPNDGYPCGNSGNRCLYYGGGCDTDSSANIASAELRAPAKDKTILMVNTARYGGCGGARAVYSAANSSATEIAVHELGHSLGGLADEYTSYPYCGNWASEINTSKNRTNGAWPEWISEIGSPREGADYYERCIFRPQDNCDMRSLNTPFCKVCSQHYSLVFFDHWRVKPTAPIESQDPPSTFTVEEDAPISFSVKTRLAVGSNVTNSITWKIQGPGYPDPTVIATGVTTYERSFSATGSYAMWCEIIADTNFIKPSKNGSNVDTVTWNITVTLAKPKEVSPPGAIQPMLFTDKESLTWEEASVNGSTTFNLYRGDAASLPSGDYGTCFKSGIATNAEKDPNTPPDGVCWIYLVTGKNSGGEGSMGKDSKGNLRPNNNHCP